MTATLLTILLALFSFTAGEDDSSHCSTGDIFPHENSCAKYYLCSHEGSKEEMECPHGMLYNTEKKMCDEAQNVKCAIESSDEYVPEEERKDDGESEELAEGSEYDAPEDKEYDEYILDVKDESTQTDDHVVNAGISEAKEIIPEDNIHNHTDSESKTQITNHKLGVHKGKDVDAHHDWHDSSHSMTKREVKEDIGKEIVTESKVTDIEDIETDVLRNTKVDRVSVQVEKTNVESNKSTQTEGVDISDAETKGEEYNYALLSEILKYLDTINRRSIGETNTTANDQNVDLSVRSFPMVSIQNQETPESHPPLQAELRKAEDGGKRVDSDNNNDQTRIGNPVIAETEGMETRRKRNPRMKRAVKAAF